jgi:hypothetical protein
MTSFFAAILLVGGVIALIKVFGLFARAQQVLHTSRSALDVIGDPALEDDRKESLLQAYSLSLLRSFLDLLLRGIGSITIPVGLLWVLQWAGVLSLKAAWDLALSWPFLLSGAIASVAIFWFFEQ